MQNSTYAKLALYANSSIANEQSNSSITCSADWKKANRKHTSEVTQNTHLTRISEKTTHCNGSSRDKEKLWSYTDMPKQ
jgi:hypothetical protein